MAKKKKNPLTPQKPTQTQVDNAIAKKLIKLEAEIELLKRTVDKIVVAYNSSKAIRL